MTSSEYLTGAIGCAEKCEIPDGVQLRDMPPTRHAWSDIVRCPNEGCERFFMVVDR
ncbi:hypothetical protein [Nocardia sp. NPDC049149]|uniref:hypothetical protein n=1 Tax=Nocardia sp. NPDC049149 TaxID=3364315 RepID=UPI003710495A